jgi:two-component system, OmpR family, response regulator
MNALALRRILHVDDDASIRASMRLLLTAEGYGVTSAATGREAVQQVRAGFHPDVLIVDSQIDEDMDGAEVAEQLRIALGYSPPVIMLTGNPARAELPWIVDAPVWLAAKPVNPQVLLIALHHLVPLSREMRAALEPKKTHAARGS